MRLHKQIRTLFQHRAGICKCRFEEVLQLRDYPAHKRNCEPTVRRCSSSLGVVWARCCDSPASLRLPPFDNRKASKTNARQLPGRTTPAKSRRTISFGKAPNNSFRAVHTPMRPQCRSGAICCDYIDRNVIKSELSTFVNLLFDKVCIIITDFRGEIK